jgi:putative chitinase
MQINNMVIPEFIECFAKYKTNSKEQDNQTLAMILAQCHYESMGFTKLEESLYYTAERLLVVFPREFKTLQQAEPYVNNPAKLANYVYANKMGNGDINSGDGYTFRGRGWIQLTGRCMYDACSKALDIDVVSNPNLIVDNHLYATLASFWYFFTYARLQNISDVGRVTMSINGSMTGLPERTLLYRSYLVWLKEMY